jgi:hypothetical protein
VWCAGVGWCDGKKRGWMTRWGCKAEIELWIQWNRARFEIESKLWRREGVARFESVFGHIEAIWNIFLVGVHVMWLYVFSERKGKPGKPTLKEAKPSQALGVGNWNNNDINSFSGIFTGYKDNKCCLSIFMIRLYICEDMERVYKALPPSPVNECSINLVNPGLVPVFAEVKNSSDRVVLSTL